MIAGGYTSAKIASALSTGLERNESAPGDRELKEMLRTIKPPVQAGPVVLCGLWSMMQRL